MSNTKENVIITGGYGMVGNNLWEHIRHQPDLLKQYNFYRFTHKSYDLIRAENCVALFTKYKPKYVIHLAALCGGIGANQMYPAMFWDHNINMSANLMATSALHKITKFITLGSVCSYPRDAKVPFKEDDLFTGWPEITNRAYGVAKLAIYEGLRAYNTQFGLEYSYLIPTNMYGPFDNLDTQTSHVIPAMITSMVEAKREKKSFVTLWGDGSPTRDFLYAEDCAKAIIAAMNIDTGTQPINLGTGEEVQMTTLAEMIANVIGFSGEIVWNKDKPNGQPRRSVNSDRARDTLFWEASTPLIKGLKLTWDWMQKKDELKKSKNKEEKPPFDLNNDDDNE